MSNILKRLNNAANGKKELRKPDEDYYTPPLPEHSPMVNTITETRFEPKQHPQPTNPTKDSVLTPDVKFVGEIEFSKSLTIYGYVKGSIKTDGTLLLEEGSDINASINANTLTIRGNFQGNITAKKNIKLLSNAVISGTIKSRSIQVEDGVTFIGEAEISTK
ncbi:MAG: polymer-forming cytoskeletal protein [Candidatus Auribacterota bacterium]|jgi:cytoskeletal protein CcmA (bactofilin family)|nr:polymer-forming cytoskeletal protein [Candidatus Auribacterota bacterium]